MRSRTAAPNHQHLENHIVRVVGVNHIDRLKLLVAMIREADLLIRRLYVGETH